MQVALGAVRVVLLLACIAGWVALGWMVHLDRTAADTNANATAAFASGVEMGRSLAVTGCVRRQ